MQTMQWSLAMAGGFKGAHLGAILIQSLIPPRFFGGTESQVGSVGRRPVFGRVVFGFDSQISVKVSLDSQIPRNRPAFPEFDFKVFNQPKYILLCLSKGTG